MTVTFTSCRDGDSAPPSSSTPQPDTVATCRSRVNRDRVTKYRVNSARVNIERVSRDRVNIDRVSRDRVNSDSVNSDRVNSDVLTLPAYVLNMSQGRQAGATVGEKVRAEARVSSEKSY